MGRSVALPADPNKIVFFIDSSDYSGDGNLDYSEFIEDVQRLFEGWCPSLQPCDRWVGREIRAVASNGHCTLTISEYCGLSAICLVAEPNPLAINWLNQQEQKLSRLMKQAFPGMILESLGYASNGEQFFRRA